LVNTNIEAFAVSGNNIFVGTAGAGIHISSDKGDNWKAVNMGLLVTSIECLAVNGTNIYTGTQRIFNGGGGGAAIFLSTNDGGNWILTIMAYEQSYCSLSVSMIQLYLLYFWDWSISFDKRRIRLDCGKQWYNKSIYNALLKSG